MAERECKMFILCVALIGLFWSSFVATTLWGWFMVPLGVPSIGYWHAVGILSLISVLMGSRGLTYRSMQDKEAKIYEIFIVAIIPAISLLVGWIAKLNFSPSIN